MSLDDAPLLDPALDAPPEPTGIRVGRRRRSRRRNTVEWIVVLIGAVLIAVLVKSFLVQAFYIPSESMLPTLEVGDRVLVNKLSYDIDNVERGHIIVFNRPDSWGEGDIDDLIKRVIGLPGETIEVRAGRVFIDGEALDEPWLEGNSSTPAFLAESGCNPACTIGENEVFVLGDNRTRSDASNHFGAVPFDDVIGRAFIRVRPLGSFGGL